MAITNNSLFKVVLIPDATYQSLVSGNNDVRATAYFAYDTKKIYVDRVAYGFNDSDITALLLLGLLETSDTNSIVITLEENAGKVKISASVRVMTSTKSWVAGTDTGVYEETVVDGFITNVTNLIEWLTAYRPAANYEENDLIRGTNGTLPATYYYAKVQVSGGAETNLLTVSSYGLQVLKSDVQDMIDASIEAVNIEGRLEHPTGCYIGGIYNGTYTTPETCTSNGGVWQVGIASLGEDGKVPAGQLPGYVDDVIAVAIRPDYSPFSSGWFALKSGCYINGEYDPAIATPSACSTAGGTWSYGTDGPSIVGEHGKMYNVVEITASPACYNSYDDIIIEGVDEPACILEGGTWYIRDTKYLNTTFRYSVASNTYVQIANPNLKSLKLGAEQSGGVIQYDNESLVGTGEVTIDQHVRWTVVTP